MRAPAHDEEPHVCPYPGWLTALIWIVAIFGSWALVLGAGAIAQALYERLLLLSGGGA